jgi:GT2 family glycosyltransferase
MPKVTLIQVIYNGLKYIPKSFDSMMNQTYENKDFVALICGNDDGGKEYIEKHYPNVEVIDLHENAFFARPHNIIFGRKDADYFQLVNQDLILSPNYVEEMVKVLEEDKTIGAGTGKLLKYDFVNDKPLDIIDTTGVVMWSNGRAADRGQNQKETSKYDRFREVLAVSGAGPIYRKMALEDIKLPKFNQVSWKVENGALVSSKLTTYNLQLTTEYEYFDEDFVAYWEDVDLGLRMQSAGWKSVYVPEALGWHGRTAASTQKDYADVQSYKKHHDSLSSFVKQMNYQNHIFLVVKNFPKISWKFFTREFFMLGYLIMLERSTLKILPNLFKLFPIMLLKRKWIKAHRKSTKWLRLIKQQGIISAVDESEELQQAKTPFLHWFKEFFHLVRLIFKK